MVYAFSLSYPPGPVWVAMIGEARTLVVPTEHCRLPPSGLQSFLLAALAVMTLSCVLMEARQILFFKLRWFRLLEVYGCILAGVGAANSQTALHITRYLTTNCIG